jgi:hypothetical protein
MLESRSLVISTAGEILNSVAIMIQKYLSGLLARPTEVRELATLRVPLGGLSMTCFLYLTGGFNYQ